MSALTLDESVLISPDLKTTSLIVAEKFGREHRNVARAIDNLEIPNDFRLLNFAQGIYTDRNGDDQRCFDMTRDGFAWPNEKNARLTFSRQSRSRVSHVRNGRVGIGIPSVKGASKAAPLIAAFSMVGRSGASSDAPKTRTPCDSGNANPVRPATRDWHLRGRFVATVTRSSAS